jgi:DNA-binding PadR family transcriptional regulator
MARRLSPQTVAVLTALADRPHDWRYGYELAKEVGLQAGTLYPILMRLADRGLLEAGWESQPPAGRPPRHLYRVTAAGAQAAAAADAHVPKPRATPRTA